MNRVITEPAMDFGVGAAGDHVVASASIEDLVSARAQAVVACRAGQDGPLLGIADVDRERLVAAHAAAVGDPHRDGVAGRGLVVQQGAIGDRDHAGGGIDGEPAAGTIGQAVAHAVAIGIAAGGGRDHRAIGRLLGNLRDQGGRARDPAAAGHMADRERGAGQGVAGPAGTQVVHVPAGGQALLAGTDLLKGMRGDLVRRADVGEEPQVIDRALEVLGAVEAAPLRILLLADGQDAAARDRVANGQPCARRHGDAVHVDRPGAVMARPGQGKMMLLAIEQLRRLERAGGHRMIADLDHEGRAAVIDGELDLIAAVTHVVREQRDIVLVHRGG